MFAGDRRDGLTRKRSAPGLARREKESADRRAFVWIVRRPYGRHAGCACLQPEMGGRGGADADSCFVPSRVDEAERVRFREASPRGLKSVAGSGVRITLATPMPATPSD